MQLNAVSWVLLNVHSSTNFLPDPEAPAHGEDIYLIGLDGELDGRISHVQAVLSEDFDGKRYEVLDSRGHSVIIKHIRGTVADWVQTEL